MNRQLFSMLKIQQLVLFIVIGLIVFVSTFNIVSTLIMTVHEKRREVGILTSMGAGQRMISRVFLWYGTMVGFAGTATGVILGVVDLLDHHPLPPRLVPARDRRGLLRLVDPLRHATDRSRDHRRVLDGRLVPRDDRSVVACRAAQSDCGAAARVRPADFHLRCFSPAGPITTNRSPLRLRRHRLLLRNRMTNRSMTTNRSRTSRSTRSCSSRISSCRAGDPAALPAIDHREDDEADQAEEEDHRDDCRDGGRSSPR